MDSEFEVLDSLLVKEMHFCCYRGEIWKQKLKLE